jgi:hypothetical protein
LRWNRGWFVLVFDGFKGGVDATPAAIIFC